MGVAITSCILAYAIFASLHKAFPRWFPAFSILENNAMQSCASAAGYMTGAGLVNAIPALMMLNPSALPSVGWVMVWIIVISWLGVFSVTTILAVGMSWSRLRRPRRDTG